MEDLRGKSSNAAAAMLIFEQHEVFAGLLYVPSRAAP